MNMSIITGVLQFGVSPLILGLMGWGSGWFSAKCKYKNEMYGVAAKDKLSARLELNECLYRIKSCFEFERGDYEDALILGDSGIKKMHGDEFLKKLKETRKKKHEEFNLNSELLKRLIDVKRQFYSQFTLKESSKLSYFITNKYASIFDDYDPKYGHMQADPSIVWDRLTEEIELIETILNYDFLKDMLELKVSRK